MEKAAYDVLGDHFLAEDVVHSAFIKVAKNIMKIEDVNSQKTRRFLIVITKNIAIDVLRKRKLQMKREILIDEMDQLEKNKEYSAYIEIETDNSVLEIINNLPVQYRDIFLMKYSAGLKSKEIAELLKLSEGTVRQRLVRGRQKLWEAMTKDQRKKQ